MAEVLGEALLMLRTDDGAFNAGVDKAKAAATGLGKTLDAASGSSLNLADKMRQAATSGEQGTRAFTVAAAATDALAIAQTNAKVAIDNSAAALRAAKITQDEHNRTVIEAKQTLALYEEEHRRAQTELRKTINAMGQTTGASAGQKAGLMQLTQQLGDMSTMYALGMRPQQIFASQIGQVTGAIQLMAGEGSKFARFLGGPWGLAISTAVMVLGPLVGELLSADDAMKKVELASDGLSDAQGVLGKMFDLTTGKLKQQNEMLRLNAQLMAINLRAQASAEKANNESAMGNFRTGTIGLSMGQKALGALGIPVGASVERENAVRQLVADMRAGRVDGMQAAKRAEGLDFSGLAVTKEEFLKAVADGVSYPEKQKIADAIEQSLKDGVLDPSLRQPGSPKKKNGKSAAEIAAAFEQDMAALDLEELQAKLDLATSTQERADIAYEMLGEQRTQREAEIDANKDYSEAQKRALKARLDALYGKESDKPGVLDLAGGLFNQQVGKQQRDEEARLANDMLARQAQTLEAWAQVSRSADERARLEAEALALQQQIQTNLLEQQIASGQVADAEKARAELASQQAAARTGLEQRSEGPLAAYVAGLRDDKLNNGRRAEALVVEELEYVHNAITDAISSRLGVKDPLLKGLLDLFIQDVLIRPIAEALQAARSSGGGGGLLGSLVKGIGSILGGASPQASLVSSASATISDPAFAGLFADGGTIPTGSWGIVGEEGPEPVFATGSGVGVMPNSALREMGGQRPGALHVTVSGARGNAEIEAMVRQGVAAGLTAYDAGVGDRVQEHLARRGQQ
ncbi:coiled-coil domain-containing protein [Novosphingobium huizhouense]|uniref:hypothetical protein n=1 Tax=Novosphingobium huizhouense TaxID=2866625 RepID=UPI001CD83A98|nr:hypothetical protein [Novosphingobium huizhouense]